MARWKDDSEMLSLIKEKLYTPVVGDILDQMGYPHQFLPAEIRPLASQVPSAMLTVRLASELGDLKSTGSPSSVPEAHTPSMDRCT